MEGKDQVEAMVNFKVPNEHAKADFVLPRYSCAYDLLIESN